MSACKIPKDFKPRILVRKTLAGTPLPPKQPEHYADFERKKTDSSEEPEECEVLFDSPDTKIAIIFTIVATGEDRFRIGDINPFQPVEKTVSFNHQSFQWMTDNPETEFETGDKIQYTQKTGGMDYHVTLIF